MKKVPPAKKIVNVEGSHVCFFEELEPGVDTDSTLPSQPHTKPQKIAPTPGNRTYRIAESQLDTEKPDTDFSRLLILWQQPAA